MFRGKVTAVDAKGCYVLVAALDAVSPQGPLAWTGVTPKVGDPVLLADTGDGASPDLVVVGVLNSATGGTDNSVPRFDGTGGAIQKSPVTITDDGRLRVASGSSGGLEVGSSGGVLHVSGTGGPSGISAPVGSTWRQTDANASHGSLTGLLWNKVGTGTAEGTDWLVDFEGRWVSYTSTLTASTTNPTNWTQTGYYTRTGKLATAKFKITAGGSMTAGSGFYRIALPASANTTIGDIEAGSVIGYDSSTGAYASVGPYVAAAGYVQMGYAAAYLGGFTAVQHATPWTWAAGDFMRGQVTYEIA